MEEIDNSRIVRREPHYGTAGFIRPGLGAPIPATMVAETDYQSGDHQRQANFPLIRQSVPLNPLAELSEITGIINAYILGDTSNPFGQMQNIMSLFDQARLNISREFSIQPFLQMQSQLNRYHETVNTFIEFCSRIQVSPEILTFVTNQLESFRSQLRTNGALLSQSNGLVGPFTPSMVFNVQGGSGGNASSAPVQRNAQESSPSLQTNQSSDSGEKKSHSSFTKKFIMGTIGAATVILGTLFKNNYSGSHKVEPVELPHQTCELPKKVEKKDVGQKLFKIWQVVTSDF